MGIMKNAPSTLIGAVTLCFVAVVAAFVYLSASGSDTSDLRTFINTVLNIVSAVFSGGALVVAGAAAKASNVTQEQTNGHLAAKDDEIQRLRASLATTWPPHARDECANAHCPYHYGPKPTQKGSQAVRNPREPGSHR